MSEWRILCGDAVEQLKTLPDGSAQCCVTSPPYWGLRDYGTAKWEGGDPACDHRQQLGGEGGSSAKQNTSAGTQTHQFRDVCGKCGARRIDNQLGLESTPDAYVATMVDVFREVRRVLADDGTLFLNLGDSYFGGARREGAYGTSGKEPEGCRASDCLCGSLCDVCRVAYQTGKAHSDGRRDPTLSPSPSASSREHTELPSGHLPTSGLVHPEGRSVVATLDLVTSSVHVDEQLPGVPVSMSPEFSRQSQGACLQASSRADGCRLCGRSLSDCVPASERKAACTCGTAVGASAGRTTRMGVSDSTYPYSTSASLKQKDIVGIPWMVAFALRADGWYLRSDIVWAKPNPMPESVTDRPTKAHEYIFLLTKSAKYFYDATAIMETVAQDKRPQRVRVDELFREHGLTDQHLAAIRACGISDTGKALITTNGAGKNDLQVQALATEAQLVLGGYYREFLIPSGRNKRSVWTVTTQSYPEAHFATFPEKLIEPCILAGTSEHGQCATCGAPWERVIEKGAPDLAHQQACGGDANDEYDGEATKDYALGGAQDPSATKARILAGMRERITTGWIPTCGCVDAGEPVPQVVLDPFNGSGTTGAVAVKYGRSYIGIELNPDYVEMARRRIRGASSLFSQEISG